MSFLKELEFMFVLGASLQKILKISDDNSFF
jgi:hypothetical protein